MSKQLIIFCALIWSGMIIGISFLEAPVKFTAPSLLLPVGLDVGRHVFAAFEKCQLLLLLLLTITTYKTFKTRTSILLIMLLLSLQVIQSQWLLPVLNDQAEAIISGGILSESFHHFIFAMIELLKLLSLLFLAWITLKSVKGWSHNENVT